MNLLLTLENMPKFLEHVSDKAKNEGFDEKRVMEITVAVDEALANIYYHAYKKNPKNLELVVLCDKAKLSIVIKDEGPFYDIIKHEDFNEAKDPSDLKLGGLGIKIIKKTVDKIKYYKESNKNILELIVYKTQQENKSNV